jgi:hypothetical protein
MLFAEMRSKTGQLNQSYGTAGAKLQAADAADPKGLFAPDDFQMARMMADAFSRRIDLIGFMAQGGNGDVKAHADGYAAV